jgi:hypothetical protein
MPARVSSFSRVIAGIFALLVILTTCLAVPLSTVERLVFDPAVVKARLNAMELYDRLPGIMGKMLVAEFDQSMPVFMQQLSQEDWEAIMSQLLTAADAQAMLESLVAQSFAYMDGSSKEIALSLVSLKTRLISDQAVSMILARVLQSQPECSLPQVLSIIAGLLSGDVTLCNPRSDSVLAVMLPLFEAPLAAAIPLIPDEIVLLPQPGSAPGISLLGIDLLPIFGDLRLLMRFSPIIPLGCLLLLALFAVRSVKGWLSLWGITLFISAALLLCLGLFTPVLLDMAWSTAILPHMPQSLPEELSEILHDLLGSFSGMIALQIILQALVLLAVGLIAWVVSLLLPAKNTLPTASKTA